MSNEISTELGLSQPTNEPSQLDTIVMLAAFRQVPERFVIDIVSKILAESLSFEKEENTLPKELYQNAILEMLKVVRTYTLEEREELKNSALTTLELLASSNIDETPWSKQLMQELSKMLPSGGDSDDEDDDGQGERPRKSIGRRAIFGGILSIGILVFSIFTSQVVDTPSPTLTSFPLEDAQTSVPSTELSLQSVPTTSTAITPLQKIQAETAAFVSQQLLFEKGAEELRKEQEEGFKIISNARESIEKEAQELVDRFTNILNPTTTTTMVFWSTTTPSRFSNPKLEEAHPGYKEARESAERVLKTSSSTLDARLDSIYSLTTSLSTAITNSPKLVTDDLKKAIGELSRNLYDYAIRHELEVPRGRDYDESLRVFVGGRFKRGEQRTRTQEMNELSFATHLIERVRRATTQILTTMDRCGMMMSMYGAAYGSLREQATSSRFESMEELEAIEEGEGEGEGEEASASTSIPGGVKLDIQRSVELYKAISLCKGVLTNPDLVSIKNEAVYRKLSKELAGDTQVASALSQSIKNRISESITRVINTIQTATEFIERTNPTPETLEGLLRSLDDIPSWLSSRGDSIEFEHSTGTQTISLPAVTRVRNIENSFRTQLGTFLRGPGREGTLDARLERLNQIITNNFGADYGDLRIALMSDLNENLQSRSNDRVRQFIQDAIILPERVELFPQDSEATMHPVSEEILQYWNTDVMRAIAERNNEQLRNIRDSQTFIGQMTFWGWTRIGTPAIATVHTVSRGVLSGLSSLAGFMGDITRDAILVSVAILSSSAVVYYLIQRATSGALFNYLTCGICRRTVGGAPPEVQASLTATTQPQINIILPPYHGFSAGIQPGSVLALPSSGASSTAMVPATTPSPSLRPIRGHHDDATPPPLPGMRWEWSPDPSPRDPEDGIWRQVPSSPAPTTGRRRMTHKNKHTIHRTKKHTSRRTKTQKRGKGKGKNKGRHSKKHVRST